MIPFREELRKTHRNTGNPVKVYILADLLEISDERWRGAVEGYLNNQKFIFWWNLPITRRPCTFMTG